MTEIVLLFENLNLKILQYILLTSLFSFNMDLRPRSHINHYLPPTTSSYRKLPSYVDAYKHYLSLKPCSDASARKRTTEKISLMHMPECGLL